MKAAVKKKWVEALRSGIYKQGRGQLVKEDKFCCLGVLCDLYGKTYKQGHWIGNQFTIRGRRFSLKLPPKVARWAGLNEAATPQIVIKGENACLENQNDGSGTSSKKTFKQIAQAIEDQL